MEDARGPENEPTRSATSINSSKLNSGAMLSAKTLSVSDLIKKYNHASSLQKHVDATTYAVFTAIDFASI